jgi:hypothetical protein
MPRFLLLLGAWVCAAQCVCASPQVHDESFALGSTKAIGPQKSPFPFTAFGYRITGRLIAPRQTVVRARFSADALQWTPWHLMQLDRDMTDEASDTYYFGLACIDKPSLYYQFEIENALPSDEPHPTATAFLIDPGQTTTIAKHKKKIVRRTSWDCPDGQHAPLWEPEYAKVTHLVVHHSDTSNVSTDWPAVVRSIWLYHAETRGWGDIGYNYLCDPNGVIYQGRAGGNGSIGAHFSCQSSGTVGIALLGTFSSTYPTPIQRRALVRILTQCARRNGIDPLATAMHPATGLKLNTICGHRDANTSETTCSTTICPGHDLYESIPQIRTTVKSRLEKTRLHK